VFQKKLEKFDGDRPINQVILGEKLKISTNSGSLSTDSFKTSKK
jgi:hypothetical protein